MGECLLDLSGWEFGQVVGFCKHGNELLFHKKQGISRLAEKLLASQKGLDFSGFDVGYCVKTVSHNHHLHQSSSSTALKP